MFFADEALGLGLKQPRRSWERAVRAGGHRNQRCQGGKGTASSRTGRAADVADV